MAYSDAIREGIGILAAHRLYDQLHVEKPFQNLRCTYIAVIHGLELSFQLHKAKREVMDQLEWSRKEKKKLFLACVFAKEVDHCGVMNCHKSISITSQRDLP